VNPATREARLAQYRRAGLEHLLVADVRVIDIKETPQETDDLDGRHRRSSGPGTAPRATGQCRDY